MVVVWGADAATEGTPTANPVISDFVLLGGTGFIALQHLTLLVL